MEWDDAPAATGPADVLPFSAIVGQPAMRAALMLNVVDPSIGGVLIGGEPGTGKSTAVHGLRALLPPIEVVAGCPFNCPPTGAGPRCPACRDRLAEAGRLPVARRPVPLVSLPIGATEDRLLGTLNLDAALRHGQRRLSPGLLAAAHRGILYLDEANLVADHLLDALLDAASSGWHRIERDGVSAAHAARFSLVGTMNPSEGNLRPQILDRFGLSVTAEVLHDQASRVAVLLRRLESQDASQRRYADADAALAARLQRARAILSRVSCTRSTLESVAALVVRAGVASHRADLVIVRTALANAALGGRPAVTPQDVAVAATLALGHRVADDGARLAAAVTALVGEEAGSADEIIRRWAEPADLLDGADRDSPQPPADNTPGGRDGPDRAAGNGAMPGHSLNGGTAAVVAGGSEPFLAPDPGRPPAAAPHGWTAVLDAPTPSRDLLALSRRRVAHPLAVRARGRAGGVPAGTAQRGPISLPLSIVAATLRQAASPTALGPDRRLELGPGDLVRSAHAGRPRLATVGVLDSSWSMAMDGLFAEARQIMSGLFAAAPRGDRVALVVAGGANAHVAVPFARTPEAALDVVRRLRPRGRTPLVDGLRRAVELCGKRWLFRNGGMAPAVVMVTDGRGDHGRADDEVARLVATVRRLALPGVIVVPATAGFSWRSESATQALARRLGWRLVVAAPAGGPT
ncbi:ATP-binding protein [Phytohabitans houttuyneae]|uniref:ATP-binding protein n=1 Tax=Phytohabitans houttuyneae TaxID=1076126 RepID=UPI001566697A|nr:ATP-binding protein [Phytohabitans houttuyneae]